MPLCEEGEKCWAEHFAGDLQITARESFREMTEQEARELLQLTALSLLGLLVLAMTLCFASHLLLPVTAAVGTVKCHWRWPPMVIRRWLFSTAAPPFHNQAGRLEPWEQHAEAAFPDLSDTRSYWVSSLQSAVLGVSNSAFVFSVCVFAPDVSGLLACLNTEWKLIWMSANMRLLLPW